MKGFLGLFTLIVCVAMAGSVQAQRRSVPQMRNEISRVLGMERAQKLVPIATLTDLTLFSDAEAGFAVVRGDAGRQAVVAYGDKPLDPENLSPEFLYLMELYNAPASSSAGDAPILKATFSDVSPMLKTSWAQGSPYYDKCPLYNGNGSRCVTGCVATAMAQALNYHKLPKKMRGYITYSYTNNAGNRVSHSLDFSQITLDWNNMRDTYTSSTFSKPTEAQKAAVATLMYVCGIATGMRYSPDDSASNPWVGADGITCFMDGLRAEYLAFDADVVVGELKANRPVIFSGSRPSSNGGHCFVIDGMRRDGYLHCNLGWGGSGDGYYLPTDMANYSTNQNIIRLWPSDERETYTPMEELQDKYATASSTPATTMTDGQWYVLWNEGRAGSPKSNGLGQTITNTSMLPCGESTIYNANQLVRFVKGFGSNYYIQTGEGTYWSSFPPNPNGGTGTTVDEKSYTFTTGAIQQGYYWLRSGNCFLGSNGPGSTVTGWAVNIPTDINSHYSWRLYPVTLTGDTDPNPNPGLEFDGTKLYTLRNTGYSQGYLVAVAEDDAHPTLRGVTQDHANGLYAGAAYHDAADLASEGAHWRITKEGSSQYLQNVLTGKYLTNSGDKTCYIFTSTKTPIKIGKNTDGTYWFNSGEQSESYLCAATNLGNPAAFWTVTDAGSIWTVQEVQTTEPNPGPNPNPGPDPTPNSTIYYIQPNGSNLYFTTHEVPDGIEFTTYSLSTRPEGFLLERVAGTNTGYTITSVNGKHVGHSVLNTWDFSDDASTWEINSLEGVPTTILKRGAYVGFGVDSAADGAGVFTDKANQKWLVFEAPTTGIRINESATPHPFYDLQGRKMRTPKGGLYIHKGKLSLQ